MRIEKIKKIIDDEFAYCWWRPEGQTSMCEAHRVCLGDRGEILGICNCGSQNLVNGESFILTSKSEIKRFLDEHHITLYPLNNLI